MIFILLFISFILSVNFNFDPDLGWHLALGQMMLESGRVIRGDPFSFTLPDYSWGNTYVLYQLLIAYLFNNLGFVALSIVFGLLGVFAIYLLVRGTKLELMRLIAILFGVVTASANLGLRPHTVSFLIFSFVLVILGKGYFKEKAHFLFWPLIFLVWSNIHRGFVVGLVIFALFVAGSILMDFTNKKKVQSVIPVFCILLSFAATFVTPFSFEAWKSGIILDITSFENVTGILEWRSAALVFPVNVFFLITGLIFIYIFIKYKSGVRLEFILGALLFALAFISLVFALFWAAIYIYIVSRYLKIRVPDLSDRFSKFLFSVTLGCVFLSIVLYLLTKFLDLGSTEKILEKSGYPVAAVEQIKTNSWGENIFGLYRWGGYLDLKLPGKKVFIDGRMASWRSGDKVILRDYFEIVGGKCESLDKYPQIDVVLLKKNSNTECFGDMHVAYEDSVAKVLVK